MNSGQTVVYYTRSHAIAEKPRDASCLIVGLQYVERNLLLLVTSASDLSLRTNKLCSVLLIRRYH